MVMLRQHQQRFLRHHLRESIGCAHQREKQQHVNAMHVASLIRKDCTSEIRVLHFSLLSDFLPHSTSFCDSFQPNSSNDGASKWVKHNRRAASAAASFVSSLASLS